MTRCYRAGYASMSASEVQRAGPGTRVRVVGRLEHVVVEEPSGEAMPKGFLPGYRAMVYDGHAEIPIVSWWQSIHPGFVQEMKGHDGATVAVKGQVRGPRSQKRIAVEDIVYLDQKL